MNSYLTSVPLTQFCQTWPQELSNLRGIKEGPRIGMHRTITVKTCHTLNSAILLPAETVPLKHDCIETKDTVYSSCPDLGNEVLPHVRKGMVQRWERFYVGGKKADRRSSNLPDPSHRIRSLAVGTSAQKAELIVFTQALELRKGKILNFLYQRDTS